MTRHGKLCENAAMLHQNTLVQYPVLSAAQSRKQGGVMDRRVFTTVQNALQVLPGERE